MHVLNFATNAEGDQLFIHADSAGLDTLIRSLTQLRLKLDQGDCDHDHLMTDAWGGVGLTERSLKEGERTVHHVKIYAWTSEWVERHHLRD